MAAPAPGGRGYPVAGYDRGKLRAGDQDRDRIAGILSTAFTEGRLTRDEYDTRLASALSARTYGDLDEIVADLPVVQPTGVSRPEAKTNGLAIASLACGFAQIMFGPLATIPAILLGHMARSQIKRTGEQGGGLALAGLLLGWAAVVLGVIFMTVIISASAKTGSGT